MRVKNSLNVERRAVREIAEFLSHLPNLKIERIERADDRSGEGVDAILTSRLGGKEVLFVIEAKSSGQPRNVRQAAHQLHRFLGRGHSQAVPIVMAPYLSPQARNVCREERVGYLDFMGNALVEFDAVYIEKEVPGSPEPERRLLRSLYKPKSARILRQLLDEPGRSWRTAELAEAAKVSAGLVSTLSARLREQGWAEQRALGLTLVEPDGLLDSWAENYDPPRGEEHRCYTALHGAGMAKQLGGIGLAEGRAALASFSAAEWLAPLVRHPNTYFYADEAGLASLTRILRLSETRQGANVIFVVPDEDGVLDDARPVADGLVATSPVQTYLDLFHAGDRGREGADMLRRQLLDWRR